MKYSESKLLENQISPYASAIKKIYFFKIG